ncbi:MAG: gamma-glutamyltransferase family protein [Phycisphaerales bacterium]|jgi:gamma-glutamyltranspeptidase/glutathione hydrolase|nr:gamma-glutamyltransferase family protein [Phycisphaerales bacterium]
MIDWSLSYSSSREPVIGKNVVACSQPLAAQAGLEMLRLGGSAVDAALASGIASTVVEPVANGIGGDAFAIVHDGEKIYGINGSGKSPSLMPTAIEDEIPSVGWLSVTVPGAVATWMMLHERFGKLKLNEVFRPAIKYARDGFLVSPQTASRWKNGTDRFRNEQSWCDTFLFDGQPPEIGQFIKLPYHANTLEEIAETSGESFYQGNLADQIDAASIAGGGFLRKEDLESHRSFWVEPMSIDVGDSGNIKFYELPPNGQGIAALIAMKLVQEVGIDLSDCDDPEVLHIQIEAMKRAFADAYSFVADPDVSGDCGDLLNDKRIKQHCESISNVATVIDKNLIPRYASTVYLATGDENGMQCSFIQSNFEGFGSGMVVPKTGIALQNRGRGFSLDSNHPNAIGPSKRPFHTIIPGFLECGNLRTPFGVMGGPMQPQGHLQVVCRMVFAKQNPQSALDAPRWKLLGDKKVAIEPGFKQEVYEQLRAYGHELLIADSRTVAFGGGQIVQGIENGYIGASDSRRDGQAVAL